MFKKSYLFAAALAGSLAFAAPASAHMVDDIEDLSDEELVEMKTELEEGLEEIKEGRAEVEAELKDEDNGRIAHAALDIASAALDTAEEVVEEVLEEVEAEQEKRAKAKS